MSSKFKVQSLKSSFETKDLLSIACRFNFASINRRILFASLFAILIICGSFITVSAQKRDNLTNEEDLQIREAQELDARMKVLVQVINRRLLALSDPNAAQSKQIQKDADSWGELRTGSSTDLLFDIQKTLDEAIAKIDDVAEPEQKNPLFSKAVYILSEACQSFSPQFKSLMDKASDQKERVIISNSLDNCAQIIEASAKVPKEIKPEKKKKN